MESGPSRLNPPRLRPMRDNRRGLNTAHATLLCIQHVHQPETAALPCENDIAPIWALLLGQRPSGVVTMLGLILLFVGAGMFINGLTMLGKIAPQEAAIMNILLGGLALLVSLLQVVHGGPGPLRAAAFGLLFSFTYLWIAYGHIHKTDGRGLGWFCLFVAATATWITLDAALASDTWGEHWMVFNWGAWAVLWAAYFVLGAFQRISWTRPVA